MEIDKRIIRPSTAALLEEFKNNFKWKNDPDREEIFDDMAEELLTRVWRQALGDADAFTFNGKATVAEAAVAACIRAGVDKSRIRFNNCRFVLSLEHYSYIVKKELSGFVSMPAGCSEKACCNKAIGLTRERFADFLFSFDALIPDIRQALDELMFEVDAVLSERKKAEMVRKLQETTARAVIDGYMKPLDISCTFHVADGGLVCLSLSKDPDLFGYVEVPYDQLSGFLQDKDKILGSLKKVKKAPRHRPTFITLKKIRTTH